MKNKNQKIQKAKCKKVENSYVLNIPDIELDKLPNVSVLTITKNRKKIFPLTIHVWNEYIYPYEKLEWVIIDDGEEDLTELLPQDGRVKYLRTDPFKTLGEKRNYGVEQCSYDYVCVMDDDDVYFPDSIIAKVKCLLHYPKKQCVYSNPIGVYNVKNKSSQVIKTEKICFPEATMLFTKKFWNSSQYGEVDSEEGKKLVNQRYKKLVDLPFWFNCICLTHGDNLTGKLRDLEDDEQASNLIDMLDDETKIIIENLH